MKSIRIIYWLQIRSIPPLPPQLWVCLMLQHWQRMWIPAKPELQNSDQRLFATERGNPHHSLAHSDCWTVLWALGNGSILETAFLGCTHLLRHFCKKRYWSLLTWGRSQIAPKNYKMMNAIFLICKMNAGCSTSPTCCSKILHCYYVWGVFPSAVLAGDTPAFLTCR